jgi:ribonuclease HI
MPFYAVANGRDVGIFLSWDECNSSVKGYKNALYKKFDKREQAEEFIRAQEFIRLNQQDTITTVEKVDDFVPDYYVYTDGACSNNGKPNAQAGIGIYFGDDDPCNVSQKIDGNQTNNAAELSAIIETYSIIEDDIANGKKVAIVTDSEYAIKCVSSYGEKCCGEGWSKDIPNKELVKLAYEMYKDKPNIKFIHIKAHTSNTDIHSIGNANADHLANMAIGLESCPYNKPSVNIGTLNTDRVEKMKKVQAEGLALFTRKNIDYGDAFAKYGVIGVLMRIEDKIQRSISITKNGVNIINDEGIRDTLIDLHNYAAMALMLLDEDDSKNA